MTQAKIYQIKITLRHSKPPIWRRLLVAEDTTLAKLHCIIQDAMAWYDYHLHQFIVGDVYYGVLDDYVSYEVKDERRAKLRDIAATEGARFIYEYDFGDSWEHIIEVEKILPPNPKQRLPVCIKGRRACPPEDVGGVWGYAAFLEAINDPQHPEHDDYLAWVGGEFNPEEFDLEAINERLSKLS